ncbi:MAG: glycosyltransferase, partial [Actinomycetes bacterium]
MKIYLVTTGSRGDFEPFYAFAEQASNLGHEVYLAVTEEFIDEIKVNTFKVLKLPGTIKQFVDSNGVSYIKNALDFLPNVRPMLVKILDVISNQIIEIKPDVVFYHPTALTAPIAAKYVKALSVLVEIIPVLSPTNEFASAGLWTSDFKFLNKLTYKGIELAEKLFFLETNKLAKKLQVKNRDHDLAISLVSPALLKRPHDWPNNSYVVGPWYQERNEELSQEITEFVERKETIYAGFGSMKKKNPLKLAET